VSALRKFFLYTLDPNQAASSERKAWCKDNMSNLQSLAEHVSHYMMSEPAFIEGGTSITDTQIEARTESVLNTYFMPE